ncbi:Tripartite-type tricarboxylate transporter, receptor component TctC [Cupriavidus sp. OV038]|jgi:tripartite-type tricarboxylate transporter receptor subunit TctC|uniref:Bug family tripartite tricarboxylate transporter substrate binding protein n=1 Tax=unclassified Cupriavidus TaxID=2640874 RepID=UPI0008EB26E8|nr:MULTISPECIES: tripartite tricarboxylate transporter substrate binding protein [unclassified Cupriavidus]SFC39687.1 Tripartite-type tricarboxylate transporter, receptor component TctC [Cupriavidus sp. OV038]SFP29834.1 Tripartite-type tricarboxylate transporter, receptor component TctC [Cupriavidus sp. OV096]
MRIRMLAPAFALAALATLATLATAPVAHAAPITRLVVAFPAGGPADSLARAISRQLELELKQTVVIDNRPGANGAIAASFVAKSPTDGSVLFLTSAGAIVINPSLYASLPYNPQKDLTPISLVVNTPEVLVVKPDAPAANAAAFVKQAQQAAKPPSLASTGVGSMPHMTIELFKAATRVNFLHVAYKGAAPAITDTLGGQVDAFFGDASGLMPFITSKRLRPIGVAAPKRLGFLPDVPTLGELGIANVEASNWYGMMGPAGTPPDVVKRVNAALRRTLDNPGVRTNLEQLGLVPAPGSAAEFTTLIRNDTAKWGRVVKEHNIHGE